MGRTSKPLTIVALPPCDEWEELEKLEKQGHEVHRISGAVGDYGDLWTRADIVLGKNCWRMDHQHKSYLALALKEARVLKYQKYEDRADAKKRAGIVSDLDAESSDKS